MPEWQLIIGSPERCRALELSVIADGYDVAWDSREEELWALSIFCTEAEMEAIEESTVAECLV